MFKTLLTHPAVTTTVRLVLGIIFIYASWDKILQPEAFAKAVQNYRFLPIETVNVFALVLPWVEFICGVLLLAGLFTAGSSLVVGLLLFSFLIAVGSALVRGIDISCGCFANEGTDRLGYWHLARDSVLFLLALHVLFYGYQAMSLDRVLKRR